MVFLKLTILFIILLIGCTPKKSAPDFHREIPYPHSKLIKQLVWESEPARYEGTGSDMHWWTWGIDGYLYVIDDDGRNFDGPAWYAHLLRSTGTPPNHKVETVNDFQFYDFRKKLPDKLVRRYVCGVVAVDSNLYVSIYDYDWNLPSKPVNRDTLYRLIQEFHPWNEIDPSIIGDVGFIDGYSKIYGVAGIIQSKDFGKTWTNLPGKNTPEFFGNKFGAPAFLTFGPGNTETPKALDPYVYAISNDGSWATGDNVFLRRVHRDSVIHRKAWQFYQGNTKSNQPQWTGEEAAATPIFLIRAMLVIPPLRTTNRLTDISSVYQAIWCHIGKMLHKRSSESGTGNRKCSYTKARTHGAHGLYFTMKNNGAGRIILLIFRKCPQIGSVKMDYPEVYFLQEIM